MYVQAAAKDPALYVGLYSTGGAPSEVDDYHWVFIVGPSHEEANSEGTLYSMEPRHHNEWYWSYSQRIVPFQGRSALLVRLMVAEVADMNMLQMAMLRWAGEVLMRVQVEWMSVRWVQRVLKSLEEDGGCLGKKMQSFEMVEAEGRRLAEIEEKKRTVDIIIRSTVLYAAVHPNDRPPCENDESHWAFLSSPANKTAESERADHVVEMQLDSHGRPVRDYSQIAVPLPDADDFRVRMLIADIANLGPLEETVYDHDVTPTVDRTTLAGNLKSKTFLRIQEKIEVLERQPDSFAFRFHKSSMCEEVLDEEVTSNEPDGKSWWPFKPGGKTFCLLRASKKPDCNEAEIVVNLNLSCPEPVTMSVAIQIVTSVLGAAAKASRRQNAAGEQQEEQSELECELIVTPREIAVRNSWFEEVQRLDLEQIIAENELEGEMAPTWFNVAAKEGEDEDEAEAEANDDDDDEEEDEGEDGRDEDSTDSGDGNEVNEMLDEEAGEKTSTPRPALVQSKTITFADFNKPGSASEGEKDKDDIETDEDEDEDDEDEDEDEDGQDSSEEDEGDDEDDEDDDENEEDSSSDDEDDDEDDSSEDDDEDDD